MPKVSDVTAATRLGLLAGSRDAAGALPEALGLVRDLLRADAAAVVLTPGSDGSAVGELVLSDGYDAQVAAALAVEFPTTRWMEMVAGSRLPPTLSTEPGNTYREGWFYCERVAPAGLRDGITGSLTSGNGVTGLLHASSEAPDRFGLRSQELLGGLLPAMSAILGRVRAPRPALPEGSRAARVAAALPGSTQLSCWVRGGAGGWYFVTIGRVGDGLEVRRLRHRERLPYDLTDRELEVLTGLALALTDAAMADLFGISVRTVHTHVDRVRGKLRAPSRTAAAVRAVREGLVSLTLPVPAPELAAGFAVTR